MNKCYYCDASGPHTLDCPTRLIVPDGVDIPGMTKRIHEVAAPKDAPYQPLKRFVIEDSGDTRTRHAWKQRWPHQPNHWDCMLCKAYTNVMDEQTGMFCPTPWASKPVLLAVSQEPDEAQVVTLPYGGGVTFHDRGYDIFRTMEDGPTKVTHVPAKTSKESE